MDSSRPSSGSQSDPARPADHYDQAPPEKVTQPRLDFVGYLRFFWRQLTSMRTALLLLLLLAIAAIPGSLVPQVSSDPNGVIQFKQDNPELAAVLDSLQVFTTYTSVWFSAIYLLLFVSLVGCVIPRTKHHFEALRARPPRTPARLSRLEGFTTRERTGVDAATAVSTAVSTAQTLLRKQGYRTELYSSAGEGSAPDSVSGERGYLRETGNLVFHTALIGVLVSVGIGGGFGFAGQRVIVEGQAFVNTLASYDSFNPGRFFTESSLEPFTIVLDSFDVSYEEQNRNALGQPIDFTANVTTTLRGGSPTPATIKVNEPLTISGTQAYLLGNGYAPRIIVRDAAGEIAFEQAVACLPIDANLSSICIVKVPDGLDSQVGMIGLLYPSAVTLDTGALASNYPDLINPLLSLEVYVGDLGLDAGVATNAYALNTAELEQVAGRTADSPTIVLAPGETAELPNGLGTVELESIPRFVSLDIHRDPSQGWVLLFSVLVVAGLLTSLFIPRRRMWVKAVVGEQGVTLEYAALARGDDPTLEAAVAALADRHTEILKA